MVAWLLFSYVDVEKRVRADQPLRAIRTIVNTTLSAEFDAPYPASGPESIPRERLLRGLAEGDIVISASDHHDGMPAVTQSRRGAIGPP